MSALKRWAAEVEDLFRISCRLEMSQPVLIHDSNMSTHLYRIAQEAVNNASNKQVLRQEKWPPPAVNKDGQ
jgi:signal transduction histidine kinase